LNSIAVNGITVYLPVANSPSYLYETSSLHLDTHFYRLSLYFCASVLLLSASILALIFENVITSNDLDSAGAWWISQAKIPNPNSCKKRNSVTITVEATVSLGFFMENPAPV
jgi:hypothetical protein